MCTLSQLALKDRWQAEVRRALMPISLIYRGAEEPWRKGTPQLQNPSLWMLSYNQTQLVKCGICTREGAPEMRTTGRK